MPTATAPAPAETDPLAGVDIPALTGHDYCDRGEPANALVRVLVAKLLDPVTGEIRYTYLDLCGHHYADAEAELVRYQVRDERSRVAPGPPGLDHGPEAAKV
jgi:hypothetical protein